MKLFFFWIAFFLFTSCTKSLDNNRSDQDSTIIEPPVTDSSKNNIVLSSFSSYYGSTLKCGYDAASKKLTYFVAPYNTDTNKLFYNANSQLSYVLSISKDLYGFIYHTNIFRHDKNGRVENVFYKTVKQQIVDTINVSDDLTGELKYDSVVYNSQNKISKIFRITTPSTYPIEDEYNLFYDDVNNLTKVVHIEEAGGMYNLKDSIEFSNFSNKINPFYRDFGFYPLLYTWFSLIYFMPYGGLNEYMTLNKYLPNNVDLVGDAPKRKYIFYTYNTDSLPTRYYLSNHSWPDVYSNFTSCEYKELK